MVDFLVFEEKGWVENQNAHPICVVLFSSVFLVNGIECHSTVRVS